MEQSSTESDPFKGYKVSIKSIETVVPADVVPVHSFPLSNLDLLLPQIYPSIYYCFKNPPPKNGNSTSECPVSFHAIVSALKVALAKVLVTYYPLAGEVVGDASSPTEILCNNRGVDFIEAYADVKLRELNFYNPDESVEDKLVPKHKAGIICIQVTELQCGGFVVACSMDHRFVDAFSCCMFLSAWAEISASRPLSRIPYFCRSLLSPHCNSSVSSPYSKADRLLITRSSVPQHDATSPSTLINRIYFIQSSDIKSLQALAGHRYTKMVAFTAYFWQLMAKSAMPHQNLCSIGIVVNGRSRLQGAHNINAMSNYFGNVISVPYGTLEVSKLCKMNLSDVAEEVNKWLAPALTKDHFEAVVNWLETHHRQPAVERLFIPELSKLDDQIACPVASIRDFPELDFGWGKSVFYSGHQPRGQRVGVVAPISMKDTGDWAIYVQVPACLVEVIEQQPSILRKMTPDYLLHEKKAKQ